MTNDPIRQALVIGEAQDTGGDCLPDSFAQDVMGDPFGPGYARVPCFALAPRPLLSLSQSGCTSIAGALLSKCCGGVDWTRTRNVEMQTGLRTPCG